MAIDRFGGINKASKKAFENAQKKSIFSNDVEVSEAKIATLSSQIAATRAKIASSRQTSMSLTQQTQGLVQGTDNFGKKQEDSAKITPPAPVNPEAFLENKLADDEAKLKEAQREVLEKIDKLLEENSEIQ